MPHRLARVAAVAAFLLLLSCLPAKFYNQLPVITKVMAQEAPKSKFGCDVVGETRTYLPGEVITSTTRFSLAELRGRDRRLLWYDLIDWTRPEAENGLKLQIGTGTTIEDWNCYGDDRRLWVEFLSRIADMNMIGFQSYPDGFAPANTTGLYTWALPPTCPLTLQPVQTTSNDQPMSRRISIPGEAAVLRMRTSGMGPDEFTWTIAPGLQMAELDRRVAEDVTILYCNPVESLEMHMLARTNLFVPGMEQFITRYSVGWALLPDLRQMIR